MAKKIETTELEIIVSRWWPLQKIKSVHVERGEDAFRNRIELSAAQAEQLYTALGDIMEPTKPHQTEGEVEV